MFSLHWQGLAFSHKLPRFQLQVSRTSYQDFNYKFTRVLLPRRPTFSAPSSYQDSTMRYIDQVKTLRASLPLNELPSGRRFPWSSYKRLSFVHWVVWYSPLCSLSCFMLTPLFFELFYAHPLLGCSCLMLNRECHHPYFAWGGVFVDCLLFIFTMYLTLFVAQHALLYTPISHGRERLSIR